MELTKEMVKCILDHKLLESPCDNCLRYNGVSCKVSKDSDKWLKEKHKELSAPARTELTEEEELSLGIC